MPEPISTISKTTSALPIDSAGRRRTTAGTARPIAETPVDSKLKATCDDMEALFIHHMLSAMRKTVAKSGLIDGGRSEEIYTSLMDAELAQEMARSGGLGLSAILQEQLRGFSGTPHGASRKR
jgi:flagellar protein FlgJ